MCRGRFFRSPSPHLTPFLPAVPAEKEISLQVHIVQKAASFSGWCFLFLLLGGLTNEKTLSQKHFRAVGSADLLHRHPRQRHDGLCRRIHRRNCGFVLGGIDENRAEIGYGVDNLYHMAQFAEWMARNGNTYVPLRSSLPKQCYSLLLDTGNVVILKRGETGYYKTDIPHTSKEEARALVEEYNRKLGVTRAQEEAMKGGSMFGFDKPIADPANYDAQGQPLKRREKDRGDTR